MFVEKVENRNQKNLKIITIFATINRRLGEEDLEQPVYDEETLLSIRSELMGGLSAEAFVKYPTQSATDTLMWLYLTKIK